MKNFYQNIKLYFEYKINVIDFVENDSVIELFVKAPFALEEIKSPLINKTYERGLFFYFQRYYNLTYLRGNFLSRYFCLSLNIYLAIKKVKQKIHYIDFLLLFYYFCQLDYQAIFGNSYLIQLDYLYFHAHHQSLG